MNRRAFACLTVLAASAGAIGCSTNDPNEPAEASAATLQEAKPGAGGGSGPVGQLLSTGGGSKAYAVNATYTVGSDGLSAAASLATAWDQTGTAIHLPGSVPGTSSALGINSTSTIVGGIGTSAVVWEPAGAGTWISAAPLPSPAGSWASTKAYAVNDQGLIAVTGTRADSLHFALRWTPTPGGYTVEVVPAAGAIDFVGHAIANGSGWITGWVYRVVGTTGQKDAFVWTAGSFRLLGRLSGANTEARGINASGRIVGWSATAPKGGDSSPVTWTCTESTCSGPTTLPAFYRNLNYAFSIDDAGDIVGTSGLSGILYSRCGTTVVLNPPAGWHQSYGWAISGDGSAAAGYSYPEGGATVQATRWALPAPAC